MVGHPERAPASTRVRGRNASRIASDMAAYRSDPFKYRFAGVGQQDRSHTAACRGLSPADRPTESWSSRLRREDGARFVLRCGGRQISSTRSKSRRENAIIALLSHPGVENAAKAAGVGTRTLMRWIKEPRRKAGGVYVPRRLGFTAFPCAFGCERAALNRIGQEGEKFFSRLVQMSADVRRCPDFEKNAREP
jgi:hypothetical protein